MSINEMKAVMFDVVKTHPNNRLSVIVLEYFGQMFGVSAKC